MLLSHVVAQVANLVVSDVVVNVTCFGANNGSIAVTVSAGTTPYAILWSNGSTSFNLTNLAPGTYTAVVTDSGGCTATISETITQPLLFSSTYVRTHATCCTGNNGTINVTPQGGTAPYTILWSNGSTSFSQINLIGGTYTYVVTDANGCTTNGSVPILAVPILASTYVTTAATCAGNNAQIMVTASGGTAPYTILWNNGSTSFNLSNLISGTYTYIITDANGCLVNGTVTIANTPILVATTTW